MFRLSASRGILGGCGRSAIGDGTHQGVPMPFSFLANSSFNTENDDMYTSVKRCFSSSSYYDDHHNKRISPFKIMGIPPSSTFDHVKQTFVRLAMTKHPDRPGGSVEEFVALRDAFELIMKDREEEKQRTAEDPEKWMQILKNRKQYQQEHHDEYEHVTPTNWQAWFHRQTGMDLAFEMTDSIRREMIQTYKTMAPGGKDKGGYWELARHLAEHDPKFSSQSKVTPPFFQIGGGGSVDSATQQPRRRKRNY